MGTKTGRNTLTSPEKIDHDVKLAGMIKARIDGQTWEEIARAFGFTTATNAQRAVKNFVKDIVTDATEEYRVVINGRFELLFNAYWKPALAGDIQSAYLVRDILIQLARFNGVGQVKVEQNLTQNNNTLIILPGKGDLPSEVAGIIEGQAYDAGDAEQS